MPWSSPSLQQGSKQGLLQGTVSVEDLAECFKGLGSLLGKLTGGSVGSNWEAIGVQAHGVTWATGPTVEVGETEFGTCSEGGFGWALLSDGLRRAHLT